MVIPVFVGQEQFSIDNIPVQYSRFKIASTTPFPDHPHQRSHANVRMIRDLRYGFGGFLLFIVYIAFSKSLGAHDKGFLQSISKTMQAVSGYFKLFLFYFLFVIFFCVYFIIFKLSFDATYIFSLQGVHLVARGTNQEELEQISSVLMETLNRSSRARENSSLHSSSQYSTLQNPQSVIYHYNTSIHPPAFSTPSTPPPKAYVIPARSVIKLKDLSNRTMIGQGAQGVVYKTEWQGTTAIYKQMKHAIDDKFKEEFMREFIVWQYVSKLISFMKLTHY